MPLLHLKVNQHKSQRSFREIQVWKLLSRKSYPVNQIANTCTDENGTVVSLLVATLNRGHPF